MQVWRRTLARIVQVATVHREHVGQTMPTRERVTQRAARHDEVRVDHIEPCARQRQAAREAARQICKHRWKICDGELAAKEHGHPHDVHTLVVGLRSELAGTRGEHRDFVATRKVAGQRGHHHAAPAAQRRVFVVTEEDAHQRKGSKFCACRASGELRLALTNLPGPLQVPLRAPMNAQPLVPQKATSTRRVLAARLEPFDSYWQAPKDIEAGYDSFAAYYRANYLGHLPPDRATRILVISCGPGYLVNVLAKAGYAAVVGIDSDPGKVEHARKRQ